MITKKSLHKLPQVVIGGVVLLLFGMMFASSKSARAYNKESREADVFGREYTENGISYDVPKADEPPREAAVVAFPNNAIIPSYITVDSIQYKVTDIREYASPLYFMGDSNSWVTLPPTLKAGNLVWAYPTHCSGCRKNRYIGVTNVNVLDLDSFLNMEYSQIHKSQNICTCSRKFHWVLYKNGKQVHNVVYPEGYDPNKCKLIGCVGLNSVTIPASDTLRTEPVNWHRGYPYYRESAPDTIRFAADSGYDLSLYMIPANNIELPNKMTVLNGYGDVGNWGGNPILDFRPRISKWPENLKEIKSAANLTIFIDDIPESVTKVAIGGMNVNLFNEPESYCLAFEECKLPSNWKKLGTSVFEIISNKSSNRSVIIEKSDEPLYITGIISIIPVYYDSPDKTREDDKVNCLFIDRDIKATIPEGERLWNFRGRYLKLGIDTVIIGSKVSVIPEGMLSMNAVPKYLAFWSMTPPDCESANPEVLAWKESTALLVEEGALDAYREHPVWEQFHNIQVSTVKGVVADCEVVSEQWYTVDGRSLTEPEYGKLCIRIATRSDGTKTNTKVFIPE